MAIPIKLLLTVVAAILDLIAEGMSESQAISTISSRYGVSKEGAVSK